MSLLNVHPLEVREEGTTLVVTIARPEALNALNKAVFDAFDVLLGWIEGAKHLRAVIITGAGEKAFVAGADIREFVDLASSGAESLAERGQKTFARFERLRLPVIAAVNGFALGGGLELALSCDFIYASENAKFGLPECTLGLMPGYGGTVRLPRKVGSAKALEMTMTGGMIDAADALRVGLVNKVVPAAELMAAALETAKTIGLRAPLAVSKIKRSVHEGQNLSTQEASALEMKLFGELFGTSDKVEGVGAFLEKRKPHFKGN